MVHLASIGANREAQKYSSKRTNARVLYLRKPGKAEQK